MVGSGEGIGSRCECAQKRIQRIWRRRRQRLSRLLLNGDPHDARPGDRGRLAGTSPGSFGNVDVWKHQVTLYLRGRETFDGDPPTAYYRLFRLITKGVPAVAGAPMIDATVHSSCYPMDLPLIQRQTDAEGLDYFEVPITFTEIGDD